MIYTICSIVFSVGIIVGYLICFFQANLAIKANKELSKEWEESYNQSQEFVKRQKEYIEELKAMIELDKKIINLNKTEREQASKWISHNAKN